mgnify:CR=1 FL=1
MHLLSILELSLAEDGPDLTTEGVFGPGDRLQAIIVAKEQTIIAGLPVIPLVMDLCAAHPEELSYTWQSLAKEGEEVAKGSIVARISGPASPPRRARDPQLREPPLRHRQPDAPLRREARRHGRPPA